MPYLSRSQSRWAHSPAGTKALGGKEKVSEWDRATDFNDLPERKPMKRHAVDLGEKGHFTVKTGSLHHMLGVPEKEKIPASKLEPKEGDSGLLRRRKASAKGFRAMDHGR